MNRPEPGSPEWCALVTASKVPARFFAQVEKTDDCWLWIGCIDSKGYGVFGIDYKTLRAHRVAYWLIAGVIPEGLVIDHLCRVRHCVNPAHMEPVTNEENVRRGISGAMAGARNRAKTHCRNGHEYAEDNTYVSPRGERQCRTCARESWRESKRRKRIRETEGVA